VSHAPYSTRLRTALVLTGTGTAGAYHAGVLRALHEAGVRIDVVAGRGAGAVGSIFAAVDGAQRLWDADGLWKQRSLRHAYRWRTSVRTAGWALLVAAGLLALPLAFFALGVITALIAVVLSLVGLSTASSAITGTYSHALDAMFAPAALPTLIPRLIVLALIVAVGALAGATLAAMWRSPRRRRVSNRTIWRLVGAPLSTEVLVDRTVAELWNLIRGAASIAAPPRQDLGRRYVELLSENLGQPGFRELLLVAHDVDARADVVFGLLADAYRQRVFGRRGDAGRPLETVDLAGAGRMHMMDALAACLAIPAGTNPHLVAYAAEGPWQGETHRVCDRPGSLVRLIEEAALAGAEQIVIVSAAPPAARPHELSAGRVDPRGGAAEQLAAFESADLRDALSRMPATVQATFAIRPSHNPVGPLDFDGVYDERSDRHYALSELVDRGYEDAYRQFVEPVVAATGEPVTVQS
jgi:patatin-like phospholipase